MICLRCDNEEFVETSDVEIEQEFRGELLKVRTAGQSCTMCGWVTVTPAQADELRRRTADAYRKNHGLLTSEEIRAMRRAMGKSQRDFAKYLDVGEASVKRWETWQAQDKKSDRQIRLKCLSALYAAAVEATKHTYINVEGVLLGEWKGIIKPGEASGMTASGEPVAKARSKADVRQRELHLECCNSQAGPIVGWPPPGESCDDEFAFSLSAAC